MREITGQENAVLNAPDGHSVAARVWVWDGAAYQNVTALEGRNWLVSVEWDESINEPCAQAKVHLRRRLEDFSLNPLVSNKLTGLLALGRPFIIEAATIPLGDAVAEEDYREVFRGKVETLNLDKDPIAFTGRDLAGPLSRNFIEEERPYGSDAGVAVETIIQSILTDNGTGVTLYVRNASGGTTTGAVFGPFNQKKMAVLAAVRDIALKIGWDLRYVWHDATSAWRFTLIEPDRAGTTGSVWTFQPHKVKAVTKLQQTLFDVRNVIRLYFFNRAVLDAGKKATLDYVTAEDATSITAYERQYMQLAEGEDSPIDSESEAQVMADAALADLKNPLLDFGVEVGFHYAVQLGDLLTFAADDIHFSNPQTLAVVTAAHRIDVRGHRTSLQLSGKPVGANDEWLRRDARVRVLSQPPASSPDPVSALQATSTAGGVVISFTPPITPPVPVEFELHISTSSGFTASGATLVDRSAATSFTRDGLTPGTTYYAQVVARDRAGNRSTAVEASFVARYVEPRALQPRIAYGALPPNCDFEAINATGDQPDSWALTTSTVWGTHVSSTSSSYSGSNAVLFSGGALAFSPGIQSQLFTVRGGDQWAFGIIWKQSIAGTAGSMVVTFLSTTNPSGTPVGTPTTIALSDVTGEAAGAPGWLTAFAGVTIPGAAKYAKVEVFRAAAYTGTLTADGLDAVRSDSYRTQWKILGDGTDPTHPFDSGWTQYDPATYNPAEFRRTATGRVEMRGMAKAPTPGPAAYASLTTLPAAFRPSRVVLYRVNSSSGVTDIKIQPDGAVSVQTVGAGAYLPLDGLSWDIA